jgi:DNA mismatch endonuclease (patch repair protein)
MDRLTPERRSWNMSRIKGRDTGPELVVRSTLHHLGFRFRVHGKKLPGLPDVVLPRHRTVIFVHGCFWHRHRRCRFAYQPKSNIPFWSDKFAQNVARDSRNRRELRRLGWRVVVVWECQAADREALAERLAAALAAVGAAPMAAANRVPRT